MELSYVHAVAESEQFIAITHIFRDSQTYLCLYTEVYSLLLLQLHAVPGACVECDRRASIPVILYRPVRVTKLHAPEENN